MENTFTVRNIFEEKTVLQKINFYDLINGQIVEPSYPEGEAQLTVTRCKSEKMYGKYAGDTKVEIILEDDNGNSLSQMFILKNGKNNNFARFLFQVLGKEQEEINLKDLEGKNIIATIFHFYNEVGVGYANIAFCRPVVLQGNN